jgi:hypothetical protein
MEERPYSSRLKKIGELLDQDSVSREEVVSELGGWTRLICSPQSFRASLGLRAGRGAWRCALGCCDSRSPSVAQKEELVASFYS